MQTRTWVLLVIGIAWLLSPVCLAGSSILFNDSGDSARSLRVVFDRPVAVTKTGDGFAEWGSEDGGISILFGRGEIAPWGNFYFHWEPADAKILWSTWAAEPPRLLAPCPFPSWGFTLQGMDGFADFTSYEMAESLKRLIATGANTVIVAPQVFMANATSNDIEPLNHRSGHQLDDIDRAIMQLRSAGLRVEIKPNLLPGSTWSAKLAPKDPVVWFSNYKQILLGYAALAEETGCAALYLTNEMESMITEPAYVGYWIDIVEGVREVFSGAISINANSYHADGPTASEVMNIPFAEVLDFIGVSLYLPLTDTLDPSVEDLARAWYGTSYGVDVVAALRDVHALYDKPVMISEVAYKSVDGANGLWLLETTRYDFQEQADLFEALMRVLVNEADGCEGSWLRGVNIWAWFTVLRPMWRQSVQNKLAEEVLAEWFSAFAAETD